MKRAFTTLAVMSTVSMLAFAAHAEPVNLVIWGLDGDNGLIGVLAKEFDDKNEDITVEFRPIAFDDLVNETLKAVATGNTPDMTALDNPDFAMFSSRGAMLDITDRVAASSVIKADLYYPGPWASVMWDGKVYGVPKATNTIALFYNKDLFAKAGIAAPPETWDELLADARKLNDPANNVYGLTWSARANEEGTFQFLPWIQMTGGSYSAVNGDGAVAALDLWKTLIDEKLGSPGRAVAGPVGFRPAPSTQAMPPWPFPARGKLGRMSTDAKFDWGVTLLPTQTKGGARSSAMGDFNWGIFAATEHPDEAFRMMEYFVAQSDRLFPEFSNIPARSDITLPSTGDARKDAALAVFVEQLKYAQPRGPHPEWAKLSKAIYDAMQSALTGQMTSKDALDQAQATIDGILKG